MGVASVRLGSDSNSTIRCCLNGAVSCTTKTVGGNGDLRRGTLDVPIGGFTDAFGAFRVVNYRAEPDGKYVAAGGDSYVLAVEFTSPPTAYSVVAYSQTDDSKSPHLNDQSALFAQEKWKRAWFTEDDIGKHLERSYRP